MTMIINVPGIASGGVDWPVLPVVTSDFPLDGLVSYLAVQGHTENASGRVGEMARWTGTDRLVGVDNTIAPIIETVSGVPMMRTTISGQQRLIAPTAPQGGAWQTWGGTGFSVAFPVQMLNLTTNVQGLLTVGGFYIRYLNTGQLQIQRSTTFRTSTPTFDFSSLAVVGVSYDSAANRMRAYRNGVRLTEDTHADWSTVVTSSPPSYGSGGNPANPSEARYGDLVRANRQWTDDEMLSVSNFLKDRFGIT